MVAREILSPLVSRFENSSPYFAPILSPLYPRKELPVLLYPPLPSKEPPGIIRAISEETRRSLVSDHAPVRTGKRGFERALPFITSDSRTTLLFHGVVAATGEREQREREKEWAEEAAASLPFVSDSLGAGIMCRRKGGGRRKEGEREEC